MNRSTSIIREQLVVDSANTHDAEMVGNENVKRIYLMVKERIKFLLRTLCVVQRSDSL